MTSKKLLGGTAHELPTDLEKALLLSRKALGAWKDITPLARNEWICWVISVKKEETRSEHIKRAVEELTDGQRRPCCWMGCVHRTDKPMSASQRFILKKKGERRNKG